MPSPEIDFRTIRPHQGSRNSGFEELVSQLAALDTPASIPFHRKGIGADAGVECYRIEADDSETAWQAKYFFEFGSSEASQLKKSFETAVAAHPKLARYIVSMPHDLSDGLVGRQKTEKQRWDDWVQARSDALGERKVSIELWGAFELTERLSRSDPLHVGRRSYWFDTLHFSREWFQQRFEGTRAALGRRYSPELNIELPVRRGLLAFARDPGFASRITALADALDEAGYRALGSIAKPLKNPQAELVATLRKELSAITVAIRLAPLGPTDRLPLDQWRALLDRAAQTLDQCSSILWDLPRAAGAREEINAALYFAEHLGDALGEVRTAIKAPETALANAQRLLLSGDAGVGKSHLLADIAAHHLAQGFPAILLLGSFFSDNDPWRQISDQLGLSGATPDAILGALDAAAEAAGTRALVMIDAINERNGVAVWAARLPAFLTTADRYPHVALLVSCRTTFVPFIVRDLDETFLPRIEHPSFAGRSAEAAKRYLDQRGIVRMTAPNLAPEFENALFLRTCCDMLERRGERELPRGLAGVSAIFDFYFGAVVEAMNSRLGLYPRAKLVETALQRLTDAMVESGSGYLSEARVQAILEDVRPSGGQAEQSLLFQLENEGVIAVEPVREGEDIVEQVRFTFERLSDHRIAERLLETHVANGDPRPAFAKGAPLNRYVSGSNADRFAGIAEAMAVQLPERYGIELLDAVETKGTRWDLVPGFKLSLLWRNQACFTQRTLDLVERYADHFDGDALLEALLAVATEPANKFNADHLDRWLRPLALAERDLLWSVRAAYVAEDGNEVIETLIEWVRANGLDQIEPERARLAAITLAWLTSLSHRWVRDMATKALAILLVPRRALAADLIAQFAAVDDPYITDRVLAAAYGAATRSASDDGLSDLARAAFDAVFAVAPLNPHALIRDHARGIIELAAHRGVLPADIPLAQVRPPYPKGQALEVIGRDILAGYVQDYSGSLFSDEICSSAVEDGDFARYEIDPLADDFLQLPREEYGRTGREIYQDWYAIAVGPHPDRLRALQAVLELGRKLAGMPFDFSRWDDEAEDEGSETRRSVEAARDAAISSFEDLMDESERVEFWMRASGYLSGPMWSERDDSWQPNYAGEKSRNWVAWRAHELGWTSERFAEFDRRVPDKGRNEHRIERIGKKYQWIAYHELTGRLSDIALFGKNYRPDPGLYEGPWQVGSRDMDPTILVTRTEQRDSSKQGPTWWSPHCPRLRSDPPQARIAWMQDRTRDIPNAAEQIEVTDPDGKRWLVLDINAGRHQWALFEGQRLIHRTTWHKVKSLIVASSDADRLVTRLNRQEHERDHPPEVSLNYYAYLGEYPWHPSHGEIEDSADIGATRPITVYPTVADMRSERAGHNYSIEDSFDLTLPAPSIVRGLGLRLANGYALNFVDAGGVVRFQDPSAEQKGFSGAVVDRDAMLAYCQDNDLELVWILTGEKSVHGGRPHGHAWGGMLEYWGIYRFSADLLSGTLEFAEKHPRPEQLEELLSNP